MLACRDSCNVFGLVKARRICGLARQSPTRVSRTATSLIIRRQIARVAKCRCFVFQVFQSGLAFERGLVRPISF